MNTVQAGATEAVIAGGRRNVIRNNVAAAVIAGGQDNVIGANSRFAAIPGGRSNTVTGSYALAAGLRAQANHAGTFVWSDTSGGAFASTEADQFLIRASGGVGIGTASPIMALDVRDGSGSGGRGGAIP